MDENEIKMDEIEMDEDTFEEEPECTDICSDESSDDSGFGKIALVTGVGAAAIGVVAGFEHKTHFFSRTKNAIIDAKNAFIGSMRNSKQKDSEPIEVEYTEVEIPDNESDK